MKSNLKYRPEIDGQRAIAVLAVIIYHAQISFFGDVIFKGGFIGVDIFFVISGYLITSIIFIDLKNNRFSFFIFYERRIRRLLPVLFFVILVFLPLAWLYYFPVDLKHFAKITRASMLFFSNFVIFESGMQYALKSSLLEPFLHTWSLSVEEQFYIICPAILLLLFKYLRNYSLLIFILGFFASLCLAEWGSRNHPSFNFYILPTRGWELLAGSILAKLEIDYGRNNRDFLTKSMPIIGMALIFFSFIFFNEEIRHPGFITLIPVVGIMLIIWFCKSDEIITKILSNKIFVGIGLISYSLYMWHYPIFAFARYLEFMNGSLIVYTIIFLLILSLSIFSYFIIEKPFRNKEVVSVKTLYISVLVLGSLLFTTSSVIFHNKAGWFPDRFPAIIKDNLSSPPWSVVKKNGAACYDRGRDHCVFNKDGSPSVYLVGDSATSTLSKSLLDLSNENNYKLTLLNKTECIYVPKFDVQVLKISRRRVCNNDLQEKRRKKILSDNNPIVITGGRFPLYLSGNYFNNNEGGVEENNIWPSKFVNSVGFDKNISLKQGFVEGIYDLLNHGSQVILIYPIPEIGWDLSRRYLYQNYGALNKFEVSAKEDVATDYNIFLSRNKESFDLLDSIEHVNISRVYPHELFCDNIKVGRCVTHNDKDLFYYDSNHLSLVGSKKLMNVIAEVIEDIYLNR
jgi:peptidoglycan/LPS O-acetylase OafA/YrhL